MTDTCRDELWVRPDDGYIGLESMSEETASVEEAAAGVSDEDIWSEDEEEEIWSEEEENIWSEEEEEEMPRETILSEEQESDIWSDDQG